MSAPATAYAWVHFAGTQGALVDAAERGEARALAKTWDASSSGDWRGFLARIATTSADISNRPAFLTNGAITVVDPSRVGYATKEHERAAATLCRTVAIVAHGDAAAPTVTRGNLASENLHSTGDAGDVEPPPSATPVFPTDPTEAFLFLVIAGPVGVAAFVGASLGARFSAAASTEERALDRADDEQELIRLTALAEIMVRAHRDAEKRAGHTLPWTASERAALAQVEALQTLVAKRMKRHELEASKFDVWAFLAGAAKGALTALEIVAALAALGAAAWLYTKATR